MDNTQTDRSSRSDNSSRGERPRFSSSSSSNRSRGFSDRSSSDRFSDRSSSRGSFGGSRGGQRNGSRSRSRRFSSKGIDPMRFVQKAQPVEEVRYVSSRTFAEMNLHPGLLSNIHYKKFDRPSEVQDRTFEAVLEGKDVLGIAQTGTGKTGAFLLPLIQRMVSKKDKFSVLVVVPTRELAQQVEEEFADFAHNLNLFSACCVGGADIRRQIRRISRRQDVVVGTPGRLHDLAKRGVLKFEQFSVLVLDEVDRMLDMGFVDDVKSIVSQLPLDYQTLFFSATTDKSVQPLMNELLTDPFIAEVDSGKSSSKNVEQDIIRLERGENKMEKLIEMLRKPEMERSLVFSQTKREVENIYDSLRQAGIKVDYISGDKSQSSRKRALDAFKLGKVDVLVATDVAARGIDVKGVTHVFNYEAPQSYEDYVHRIGRTGRAGKMGWSFTFVN